MDAALQRSRNFRVITGVQTDMIGFIRWSSVATLVFVMGSQMPGCVPVGTTDTTRPRSVSDSRTTVSPDSRDLTPSDLESTDRGMGEATSSTEDRSTPSSSDPSPGEQEWVERGTASWYGEAHHGKQTASGEPFDMYAMTAAHPTLEMGTRVEVENLENGRTVIVRVNDRGPFVDDRIVDLSMAAAQALGFVAAGSAEVELRLLR